MQASPTSVCVVVIPRANATKPPRRCRRPPKQSLANLLPMFFFRRAGHIMSCRGVPWTLTILDKPHLNSNTGLEMLRPCASAHLSCGALLDATMKVKEANTDKVSFYTTIDSISLVFSFIANTPDASMQTQAPYGSMQHAAQV